MKTILSILLLTTFSLMSAFAMDDASIAKALEKQFRNFVPTTAVVAEVEVENGVVTLQGTAENLPSKTLATEMARSIRGVRGIVNRLRIREMDRADNVIVYDLERLFDLNYPADRDPITTKVNDGVVTLTGDVSTYELYALAEVTAESVIGVRSVTNLLRVKPLTPSTDSEIDQHLTLLMRNDPWIQQDLVTLEVTDGVVLIKGSVDTISEKERLRELAQVYGVRKVDTTLLNVDPSIQPEWQRPHAPIFRSDEDIKKSIELALQSDGRLGPKPLTVEVVDREATLIGPVDSIGAKVAAENDARNTPGILNVYSFLYVVTDDSITDDSLEKSLTEVFAGDALLNNADVTAKVDKGVVSLEGKVETTYQRRRAIKIASFATGVKQVVSKLRVDWETPAMTDEAEVSLNNNQ